MAEKKAPPEQEAAQAPKKPPKKREKWDGKKIVATRAARAGDHGYELSSAEGQVALILEDGSEQVVKESQQYEPTE